MVRTLLRAASICLALAMLVLTIPGQGWAMFIPVDEMANGPDRATIRRILESKLFEQRLADLGLSPVEARARIDKLSDEQLHRLASKIDSLQAGGDVMGAVIIGLVAAVLVVTILELNGYSVVVR